jgi:hypothetical protein
MATDDMVHIVWGGKRLALRSPALSGLRCAPSMHIPAAPDPMVFDDSQAICGRARGPPFVSLLSSRNPGESGRIPLAPTIQCLTVHHPLDNSLGRGLTYAMKGSM